MKQKKRKKQGIYFLNKLKKWEKKGWDTSKLLITNE
jgi:hypothetical protein